MSTQTFVGTLVVISCWKCGVHFGMTRELQEECLKDRGSRTFFCPNGHGQVYTGKTEAQRERELREEAEKRTQWAREDAARQRKLCETAERSARASSAHYRRIKSRVAHWVCPCCNRSFVNVARHMIAKHPEWKRSP